MSLAASAPASGVLPRSSKQASIARKNINISFKELLKRFGKLNWWPAETRDEVIIGAILTQNTNWSNVEKALSNLNFLVEVSTITLTGKEGSKGKGCILVWK